MAKSTNGGTAKGTTGKGTSGEPKARRAPARRQSEKKLVQAPVALASELARSEIAAGQPAVVPSPEEVRRRAYEIYIGRGCTNGCDVDDWLEAERQLRNSNRPH
jgi:hypothetical protein